MSCTFCKIVSGELPTNLLWENDDFIAILDIRPIHAGHILIIPRKHIDYIFNVDEPTYQGIFNVAKKLAGPLKKATDAKRIGISVEGLDLPHLHLHLIPINKVNDLDPCLAKEASESDLQEMKNKIVAAMDTNS